MGTAATVKAFTADDLRKFHAQHYVPSTRCSIVTGDVIAPTRCPGSSQAFRRVEGDGSHSSAIPQAPAAPPSRRIYLIDKPGAAQSQIRIGWIGVPRSTPDYFALRVLEHDSRRLVHVAPEQNLREEHGYAYGAGSSFDMRAAAGPFYASAGVQTDKTAEAFTRILQRAEAHSRTDSSRGDAESRRTTSRCCCRGISRRRRGGEVGRAALYLQPAERLSTRPTPIASAR